MVTRTGGPFGLGELQEIPRKERAAKAERAEKAE
jgi:hypothetical protein